MPDKEHETHDAEQWAIVELMGHDMTAGLVRPSEVGGTMRLDVPVEDGFRTEYIGPGAIFRVRIVSEEIARAYAPARRDIAGCNTPVVPREEFDEALRKTRAVVSDLTRRNEELARRLTAVADAPALPKAPEEEGGGHYGDCFDCEWFGPMVHVSHVGGVCPNCGSDNVCEKERSY